uniref:hypothetical protein n=1 Tax=uncultured Bilophila sp. TaxID=529385 RepID=UPI0025F03924|nr:hypothetical protein [uncultured Bilophila sp.]
MAQKTPYDPEEGIIDLFDIVDDPEASPQPEPCGAVRVGGGAGDAVPEPAEREEDPGYIVSRYPFENVDECQNIPESGVSGESGKAPEAATPWADPVPEASAPEASSEDLIRAFEEEMAKAGAVAREGGDEDAPEPPFASAPTEAACDPERPVDGASGVDASEDLGVLFGTGPASAEAAFVEKDAPFRETPPAERDLAGETGEASYEGKAERAEGESTLEELFPEQPLAPEEPVSEAEPDVPEQPEDVPHVEAESVVPQPGNQEAAERESGEPQSGDPELVMPEPQAGEPVAEPEPLPEPASVLSPLAVSVEASGDDPVKAAEPVPSEPDDVEERLTRLEEALSRLNERVTALEQRVNESGEEAAGAVSGDIEALLTEGNALCGQLRALAASRDFASSVAPEPKFIPEPDPEETSASHPSFAEAVSREAEPAADESDDGPDLFGLALESLEGRVSVLEKRPVLAAPDAAGIAQDVLALVRVDMEKACEEQETTARVLEQLQRRVQDLESRPLPQLILPDLPDAEAITADVMSRVRAEIDRIAAESAARVLREEIANLMKR